MFILDVKLPDLDGFALHKRLMQRGGLEEIVFVTGHGHIPMGVQAMKNGAVDFLPKPFDDEVLLRAVSQAIARSCERWQRREETSRIRARLAKLTPRR
jgi:FixJ family two-component response regulator